MDEYRKYEPIFGSWYLKKLIGKGSFGKVFEITREEYGREYRAALKIISVPQDEDDVKARMTEGTEMESVSEYYEGILQEIINENDIMTKLKGNSNIVSYEDHQIIPHDDGIGYDILIRMELLTPLLDRMIEKRLDEKEVVKLGIDICKALELCHRKNIIHRDIKPQNIFISDNGDFKLGDFGIARTMEKTTGGMSKKGTYKYMAPEVFRGEHYDSSVDIYSLGIVLFSLLNGNRGPFLPAPPAKVTHNDEEEARMRRFRGEPIPAPRDAGVMLTYIIKKACEADPAKRYRTAEQMRRDLESYLENYDQQERTMPSFDSEATVMDETARSYTGQYSVPPQGDPRYTGQYSVPPQSDQRYTGQYSMPPQMGAAAAPVRPAEPVKKASGGKAIKIAAIILGVLVLAGAVAAVIVHNSAKKAEEQTAEGKDTTVEGAGSGEEGAGGGEELPPGVVEFNGHRYKVVNEGMSWNEAESACEKEGGHLVTITSAEEQAFVKDLLEKDGLVMKHYWIGATDRENEGVWKWINGEEFGYSNWDPGDNNGHDPQPNNKSGQDYVEIQTISNTGSNYMTWNDANENCDTGVNTGDPWYYSRPYFGYICEWE